MSQIGEGNNMMLGDNLNKNEGVEKSLLDEIDNGEKTKGEQNKNWKGTLTRLFKNKPNFGEGAELEGGHKSDDDVNRKSSTLSRIFKRATLDAKKASSTSNSTPDGGDTNDDERPKRSKALGKLLKRWPFKNESSSTASSQSSRDINAAQMGVVKN